MNLNVVLPRLATVLINAGDERQRRKLLRQESSKLYSHLQRVGKERRGLGRWGQSVNVDELAKSSIVDPVLLQLIGTVANTRMKSPGFHAGLQHTYGYLLSLIETPYGFKRDRWITSTIEDGFGLPAHSLQAFPKRGTLLINLTSFLSHISLSEQSRLKVLGTVANFDRIDWSSVNGWRITEQAETSVTGKEQRLEIRTDIVPFLKPTNSHECLLVYSLRLDRRPYKLITTFPIQSQVVESLMDPTRLGKKQHIRLRYNAYSPGFCGVDLLGKRTLAPLPSIRN